MSKEITMSIHQFMRVQRNELTYKDLEDYQSFLDNLNPSMFTLEEGLKLANFAMTLGLLSVLVPKIIEFSINPALSVASTCTCTALNTTNSQLDGDLIKEGFQLLYTTASSFLEYTYKFFTAISQNI